jgi:hypothetical protein
VKVGSAWKTRADATRAAINEMRDQLEAAIDKTPNSPEEQREMIADLKVVKKELQLLKREANEAMRQIRSDARAKSAKIGTTGFGALLSTPTSRRWSRVAVRLEKESNVAPHEQNRAVIERRLLVVERAIHWIERFR